MERRRPIVPEDLYAYRWISEPAVSVRGAVAYVHQTIDREKNEYRSHIRTLPLAGGSDAALTDGDKDGAPRWSPDGAMLAFLRIQNGSRQIWTVPAEGGEPKRASNAKRGVGAFAWSPDGKCIAYTSRVHNDPEREAMPLEEDRKLEASIGKAFTRTAPKAEGAGLWDGLHAHLFVLSLEDGTEKRLTFGAFDASQPAWSPDGSCISFLAKVIEDPETDPDLSAVNDIFTIRRDGGEPARRTDASLSISQFCYAPDGKTMALIANDRTYGSGTQNRLYLSMEHGETVPLVSLDSELHVGNFALSEMKAGGGFPGPAYDPSGTCVYALASKHGSVHIYRFAVGREPEAITSRDRDIYHFDVAADGRYMVMASTDPSRPGELYRVHVESGAEERLTQANDEFLSTVNVSLPEAFRFESSDGLSLHGWIMFPADREPGRKLPLILQIHGGPHAMYAHTYSHEFQSLVSQGYAVLFINPRGSFGYGQHFAKACRGDFGGGDVRDVTEAVDAALARYPILDGERLGVAGGSYGGLMTNWIVSHSTRFRAAVTQRCISNWMSFYGMSDIGISYTEGIVGGNPWDDPELLWEKSPIAHVKAVDAPLLIIHGESDLRCPIEQADQLYVALKRLGKRTKLIRYPGSNHFLLKSGKPSYRVDVLKQTNAWFDQYL